MPWWAILYLIVFIPFTGYAIWLDIAEKKPWWRFLAEAAACLFEILMFVGAFVAGVGAAIGLAVIPMLVYAVGWDIYMVQREFAEETPHDATSFKDRIGMAVGLGLLLLPTYIAGAVLVVRSLRALAA